MIEILYVTHARKSRTSVKCLHLRVEVNFRKMSKTETSKLKYEILGFLRTAPDGLVRGLLDHVNVPLTSVMAAETALRGLPPLSPGPSFDTNPR
jgi:hypothetical protein